jgi:hypothetical protein
MRKHNVDFKKVLNAIVIYCVIVLVLYYFTAHTANAESTIYSGDNTATSNKEPHHVNLMDQHNTKKHSINTEKATKSNKEIMDAIREAIKHKYPQNQKPKVDSNEGK